MSDFKCTIIMSNYNQAKYIEKAINSVLIQKTNFSWLLIITDDYSTKDNSVEIIKNYADKYPDKIKILLNTENGRYLKNILRAKAITKTEYFCLLDADDYWIDTNYLQDAVNFLDNNPDYVIYSRNVICKEENGSEHLFISPKVPISNYNINDYFNHIINITQTTGTFFRNVIFKNGIPKIMENAVGSISERSFEGDFDRYIMHLKYGKAHYEPKPVGVYRILTSGIWSKLCDYEQQLIQAQCNFDYNTYFDNKYKDFFVNETYKNLLKIFDCLAHMDQDYFFSKNAKRMFLNALNFCSQNRQLILIKREKYKKIFKYKFLLFVYKKLKKYLIKKGLA